MELALAVGIVVASGLLGVPDCSVLRGARVPPRLHLCLGHSTVLTMYE